MVHRLHVVHHMPPHRLPRAASGTIARGGYGSAMERIGLSPGAEIGGYTILAPLGSGGMGTVYRAVDGGGTPVALKLLHPHVGADPSSRERLRREVLALQRLRHPGVAAVLDAEADSTEAFLVTELVSGSDLNEHVRARGPLDPEQLHRLADGLRDALAAVHAAGVVHRDLKPSNVLVTGDGPVLIDFGIAQSVDETRVTSAGFVVGTPGYLAPELIDGAEPTPATDWWGWAALLAFAATGRAPFGTRPLEAVLVRTRTGDADLAGLGPMTAGALWDALAADPADRAEPEQVVEALAEAMRRGERYSPEAATTVLAGPGGSATGATAVLGAAGATVVLGGAAAGAAAQAGITGGSTVAFGAADATPTVAHPSVPPASVPPQPGTWPAGSEATVTGATVALPPGTGTPAQDGSTRAFPSPSSDRPADAWETRAWDNHAWDEPADGAERPEVEPPTAPPHRTGTLLALALLIVAGAARYPGVVVFALVPLLLAARTVGSVVQALARRRERVGARRSDGLRAAVSSPWHLLRSLVTLLPSLLVAASVVVITLGVGWWLVGSGTVEGGPLRAAGDAPTDTAATVLLAVATAGGLAALWWGPLARTTRIGARWVLSGVAPGRGGASVVVVLALLGAAVLLGVAATGTAVDWSPLPAPTLPAGV